MDEDKILVLQEESQRLKEIEESLEIIERQIAELDKFSNDLNLLEKSEEKEILAPLGKGVYIKSEIKSKEVVVDVGAGVFVKKNISQTKEIISNQLEKLRKMKALQNIEIENSNARLKNIIKDIEQKDS